MKRREIKLREWKPIRRFAFAFLAFLLIATGAISLLGGKLHYSNYWGAPVFAPFVIFIGLLGLVGGFTHRKKSK